MSSPVAYVGGSARSGSTLLEQILACVPGYCPVGEIVFIWERCVRRNDRCGCGERFHDCAFWDKVGRVAFGGWDHVDADKAIELRTMVDRHRNLPRLAGLRPPGALEPAIAKYAALTERLYAAVTEVSGAAVIVDSSKHVSYALLLRRLQSLDLRLIHLVRRSHGVVHSWTKQVRKPGVGDGTEFMSVHSPAWSVGLWAIDNLLFDALERRSSRASMVRYEDLVANPVGEVTRLAAELRLPAVADSLDFLTHDNAELPVSHGLSGNPSRLTRGPLALHADEDWRDAMSGTRKFVVSAATWPLLLKYGYPIGSGG